MGIRGDRGLGRGCREGLGSRVVGNREGEGAEWWAWDVG